MISVASTSIVNRSGTPSSSQNRARALACASRTASNIPSRRDLLDHPERRRVRRHRPEQHFLLTSRNETRDAFAARHFYGYRASITHHPQGETSKLYRALRGRLCAQLGVVLFAAALVAAVFPLRSQLW